MDDNYRNLDLPLNQEAFDEDLRHPPRNVRPRNRGHDPFTPTFQNQDDFIPNNWSRLTISDLMDTNVSQKKTYVRLQLLHIVSGSSMGSNTTNFNYYNRQKRDRQNTSTYQRMFLFRELDSKIGQVVYMIKSSGQNDRLWVRNAELCDNGIITIGTCVAVIRPCPIVNQLCNEVPLLESRGSLIIYNDPNCLLQVRIDNELPQNVTRAFVLNNTRIEIISSHAVATKCSGLFCDCQHAQEIIKDRRGCGCYSMQTRLSNIAMIHTILVTSEHHNPIFCMEDFSSVQSTRLFLSPTGLFPLTTRINSFESIRTMSTVEDSIDNVVNYINKHDGFTIVGWYKRGEINDQGGNQGDNEEKVEAGEIGFHVVLLKPTDSNIQIAEGLKFNVNTLNGVV